MAEPRVLSPAARRHLAGLERRRMPTLHETRAAFARRGVELPDVVAAIQDDFGGYVLPLGRDSAVLGIYHARPLHLPNLGFDYDDERPRGGEYIIACADAHPSYDFWVTETGEFCGSGCGGGASSLAMKIEKRAVYDVIAGDRSWVWCSVAEPAAEPDLNQHLVVEASDGISSMYRTPDVIFQRFTDGGSTVIARLGAAASLGGWLRFPK